MERGEDGGYGRNRRGEDPDSYILYILYSILFSFSILPLSRLCPSFISFSILKFDWSCATGQAAGDGEGRLLQGEQRLLLACGALMLCATRNDKFERRELKRTSIIMGKEKTEKTSL